MRKGDWIGTYTGKAFYPMDPRPDEVDIEDIAHALSQTCRYAGHTRVPFSVAQHSVLVSRHVPPEFRLWGLLHDATEAYICDIPRPLKGHLTNYKYIEDHLMSVIAKKFGLKGTIPPEVKEVDNRILWDERAAFFKKVPDQPWDLTAKPLGIKIHPLPPEEAKAEFLLRYWQYTHEEIKDEVM